MAPPKCAWLWESQYSGLYDHAQKDQGDRRQEDAKFSRANLAHLSPKAAILTAAGASSRCFGVRRFRAERIASADSWMSKDYNQYRSAVSGRKRPRVVTINRSHRIDSKSF